MKLLYSGFHDYVAAASMCSGAYAWWYNDIQADSNEWTVVLIGFAGMPMSPDYISAQRSSKALPADHCGYAVNIYHRGRRVLFAFHGTTHVPATLCGDSEVSIDTGACSALQSAEVVVRFQPLFSESSSRETTTFVSDHVWNVFAPRRRASVSLTIREAGAVKVSTTFEGWGYTDRNAGRSPLHRDFGPWYWGRIHHREATHVFLATLQPGVTSCNVVSMQGTSRCLEEWNGTSIDIVGKKTTMFGMRRATHVTVTGELQGKQHRLVCTIQQILDSGPFYQRFKTMWTMDGKALGDGIGEYMAPHQLQKQYLLPFLRLPWQKCTFD